MVFCNLCGLLVISRNGVPAIYFHYLRLGHNMHVLKFKFDSAIEVMDFNV